MTAEIIDLEPIETENEIVTGTEIAVLEPKNPLVAFQKPKGLDPFIERVRLAALKELEGFDISTEKGRDKFRSVAFEVAKAKTGLDRLKKSLTKEEKEKLARIDEEGTRAWEAMEALQKEIRKPLTDWENSEKERVKALEADVLTISACGNFEGFLPESIPSSAIEERLQRLAGLFPGKAWEEFETRATTARKVAQFDLERLLKEAKAREAAEAERKRLQLEEEARKQKEREDEIQRLAREEQRLADEKKAEEQRIKVEAERAFDSMFAQAQLDNAEFDADAAGRKAEKEKAEAKARETALEEQRKEQERLRLHADQDRRAAEDRAKEAEVLAEQQRVARHKKNLDVVRTLDDFDEADELPAEAEIVARINRVAEFSDLDWQEFADEFVNIFSTVLPNLRDLRKLRIATDKEAEEKRNKAISDKAAQEERDRAAKFIRENEAAAAEREKNTKHKKAINNAALAVIQAVVDSAFANEIGKLEAGKKIIELIAKGEVPHVSIKY